MQYSSTASQTTFSKNDHTVESTTGHFNKHWMFQPSLIQGVYLTALVLSMLHSAVQKSETISTFSTPLNSTCFYLYIVQIYRYSASLLHLLHWLWRQWVSQSDGCPTGVFLGSTLEHNWSIWCEVCITFHFIVWCIERHWVSQPGWGSRGKLSLALVTFKGTLFYDLFLVLLNDFAFLIIFISIFSVRGYRTESAKMPAVPKGPFQKGLIYSRSSQCLDSYFTVGVYIIIV